MRNHGKQLLGIALLLCCLLALTACSAVSGVEQKISSIGTVTLEKQTAIEEAEAAFNALSADEQAKVSNYETLQSARTTLDKLIEADKREKEYRARKLKDQQDAVSLAEKIITVMGTTFKSPLNLTVENIWYLHAKYDTSESWHFTFQISAPNGYGVYL